MMPSMNGINNLNFTLICALGAVLALSGKISVGNISSFVLYSKKFSAPIVDTANIINMLQSSLAACDRVFSILNAEAEPDEALPQSVPPRVRGDTVSYTHLDDPYRVCVPCDQPPSDGAGTHQYAAVHILHPGMRNPVFPHLYRDLLGDGPGLLYDCKPAGITGGISFLTAARSGPP